VKGVNISWGKKTALQVGDVTFNLNSSICRYLARTPSAASLGLYGKLVLDKAEVDFWLSFSSGPLSCSKELDDAVAYLDRVLGPLTFLVGGSLTIADLAVWGALFG